jgi:hypothetical protein
VKTGPPGSENKDFMAAAKNSLESRGFLDPSEVQTWLNVNDVPVDLEPRAEEISPGESGEGFTAFVRDFPSPDPDLGHLPIARTIIDLRSYRFDEYTDDSMQFRLCSCPTIHDRVAVLMIPCEIAPEPNVSFRKPVVRFFHDLGLSHRIRCPTIQQIRGWNIFANEDNLQFVIVSDDLNGTFRPGMPFFDNATEKMNYLYGVAHGMRYLHSRRGFHLGLRPWNILVDADKHARVISFPIDYRWKSHGPADDVLCFGLLVFEVVEDSSLEPPCAFPDCLARKILQFRRPQFTRLSDSQIAWVNRL